LTNGSRYAIIRSWKGEALPKKGEIKMLTSVIIIVAYEVVSEIKGAFDVPEWLDNAYEAVGNFWDKILP
jgi:hypothetical protein